MKARTLRHLVLLSGKSIAVETTDSELRTRIHEICNSLAVHRERQSPFSLTYEVDGIEKSLSVDDALFSFHVRGDVPNRLHITQNRDIRKENWSQALLLWRQMLEVSNLGNEDKIAPVHHVMPNLSNGVRFVRLAVLVVGIIAAVFAESASALALVPLLCFGVLSRVPIKHSWVHEILFFALAAWGSVVDKLAIGLLLFLIVELVVAYLTDRYLRIASALAGVVILAVCQHSKFSYGLDFTGIRMTAFLVWLAIALLMFPRGTARDFSRTSVPLALSVLALSTSVSGGVVLAASIIGFVPLINWKRANTPDADASRYVAVTIRKR